MFGPPFYFLLVLNDIYLVLLKALRSLVPNIVTSFP